MPDPLPRFAERLLLIVPGLQPVRHAPVFLAAVGALAHLRGQKDEGCWRRGRDPIHDYPEVAHDLVQRGTEGDRVALAQGLDLNADEAGGVAAIGDDVGGGNGTLIAAILAVAPKLRGIIFDLPSGNAGALRQLEASGVAERCDVIEGDFFRSVPAGADAYVLKAIIHDWDDERSIAILKNCRRAMSADGKLLLVERVMPVKVEASQSHRQMAMVDIHMLVLAGGRERTVAEYQALFAAAGFELTRFLPLREIAGISLIEAAPV